MFKKIKAWWHARNCAKGKHVYEEGCYVKGRVRERQQRRVRYWFECEHCGHMTEPMSKKQLIQKGKELGWVNYGDG